MNSAMVRGILSLSCVACLTVGCGNPPVAGGTGTDAGEARAMVTLSNGSPAVGATVKFVSATAWINGLENDASSPSLTLTADSAGEFVVDTLLEGVHHLQIDAHGEGLFVAGVESVMVDIDSTEYVLVPYQTLAFTVDTAGDRADQVWLVGTDYTATPAADDNFILNAPSGYYNVIARSRSTKELVYCNDVFIGAGATTDTVLVTPGMILVDDFEDNDQRIAIHSLTRWGNWYSVCDSTTALTPIAWRNTPYLNFEYDLGEGTGADGPYAIAGISFHAGNKHYLADFSSLDSLCFRARGNTSLIVRLELYRDTLETTRGQATVTLDESWREYHITFGDLGEISNISFIALEGDYFCLDDIRVYGMDLAVWIADQATTW